MKYIKIINTDQIIIDGFGYIRDGIGIVFDRGNSVKECIPWKQIKRVFVAADYITERTDNRKKRSGKQQIEAINKAINEQTDEFNYSMFIHSNE